ncbi:hypothetical protein [uncultured Clostridium sp.]|uniref:hypothetical protein n=1 Tax=uncultured Clostridium sp. TaxID=59620 RepID=UPI0028EFABBC|nr:hypothetical protein [uncultured Clostridium sp.]
MPDPEVKVQENTSADEKAETSSSQTSNKESSKTENVSADDSKTNTKDDNSNMAVQGGNTVAQTTKQEELYDIQDLIANSKALGYRKEVVTGALFNCEKTQMSKSELDENIKKFLGKKVK